MKTVSVPASRGTQDGEDCPYEEYSMVPCNNNHCHSSARVREDSHCPTVFPHPERPGKRSVRRTTKALITKLTPDQVVQLLNAASVPSEVVEDDNTTNGLWQFWGKDSTAV